MTSTDGQIMKKSLKKVDKTIVVTEESGERIIGYGISNDKIEVISNTEDVEGFNDIELDMEILSKYKNILLFYIREDLVFTGDLNVQ